MEGEKSTAKGVAFENVVLADMMRLNGPDLGNFLSLFGIIYTEDPELRLPTTQSQVDDETFLSDRPLNVFFRPSNQCRPDILAFPSSNVCLSFGIKLYTNNIPSTVHDDNMESTDPQLFFMKNRKPTNTSKRQQWLTSLSAIPLKSSIRFLFEFPQPVNYDDMKEVTIDGSNMIILISQQNMHKILSPGVCLLIQFITT